MDEKIFAGIVLYNPDLDRLKENVEHISRQVELIILVNNGSRNTKEIEFFLKEIRNCHYINLHENKGIAVALNVIASETKKRGANWVVTLDQDTVCYDNLVENYSKFLNAKDIGQITCFYKDRNFNDDGNRQSYDGLIDIDWCITSAALLNINAWCRVGGFDEKLFIDAVDYDICLSMRENGYHIYQAGFVGFLHEIGNGKVVKLCGLSIKTWNHSPFRRYYSARNAMIVARKHKHISTIHTFFGTLKHIIIIFIFEDDKWNRLKCGIKGLINGIREKVSI